MNKSEIALVAFMVLIVVLGHSVAVFGSHYVSKQCKAQGKHTNNTWLWFECVGDPILKS